MLYLSEEFLYVFIEWVDYSEGYIDICYYKLIDGIVKIIINCLEVCNVFCL